MTRALVMAAILGLLLGLVKFVFNRRKKTPTIPPGGYRADYLVAIHTVEDQTSTGGFYNWRTKIHATFSVPGRQPIGKKYKLTVQEIGVMTTHETQPGPTC
jgi:hypothetical protein